MRKNRSETRGVLTGTGPTRKDAKADLERQIDEALRSNEPFIEPRFGSVIIIVATAHGWQSTLMMPYEIAAHGKAKTYTCFSGWTDREKLVQSSRTHAAQNAWTHDTNDAAHVAAAGLDKSHTEDLQRWIKFQRDYLAAKAAGKTDREAFDIATGRA